jgi:hypothetical protein
VSRNKMSFTNQSGDLMSFTEVVPGSAQFGSPEKSSILTARRRVRVTPQTGPSIGSAGAGAGGQQVQLLLADNGGLLDLRSVVLNYTIQTSGTAAPCPDDGHPFMTVQALLNGQTLETITNAPKLTNLEMTMGGSQQYYKSAGSLQGFELLNEDLKTQFTPITATTDITANSIGAYGFVVANQGSIAARSARAANAVFNGIAGEQRSIPLGLIMGLGRCATYLPISLLGELTFILQTGQAADVLFSTAASGTADYSLSNISLTYEIVVHDSRYMYVLQKMATESGDGLVIPFESSIVTPGAAIASSATLAENTVIVSRATNNLLRASLLMVPQAVVSSVFYPSQSAFSHAGTYSVQYRVGSIVYPQTAAQGDADLFNMSMSAYGSALQENGWVGNRVLWANSTNPATAGTPAVFETAEAASSGTVKFAYADRFCATYGFATVKGGVEPMAVDGISLSGSSGSQLIASIIGAPGAAYTPYIVLTALKFVKAQGGAVSVVGA